MTHIIEFKQLQSQWYINSYCPHLGVLCAEPFQLPSTTTLSHGSFFHKTQFFGISRVSLVRGENSSGQKFRFFLANNFRQGKFLNFFLARILHCHKHCQAAEAYTAPDMKSWLSFRRLFHQSEWENVLNGRKENNLSQSTIFFKKAINFVSSSRWKIRQDWFCPKTIFPFKGWMRKNDFLSNQNIL